MDCEKCQELLGDLLDGTLNDRDEKLLSAHFGECLCCAGVREELQSIALAARDAREYLIAPPDEHALWLRIRNTVESELNGRAAGRAAAASRTGFWGRLMDKRWELTLPQMTGAVAAIIIVVSLATVLGVQGLRRATPRAELAAGGAEPAGGLVRRQGLPVVGHYPESYLRQQEADINYWRQRVEMRRANWNPRLRESFDRSLLVIDQAVKESLEELNRNPHDEVSEEILNAVLRDKKDLLKEFSEQ